MGLHCNIEVHHVTYTQEFANKPIKATLYNVDEEINRFGNWPNCNSVLLGNVTCESTVNLALRDHLMKWLWKTGGLSKQAQINMFKLNSGNLESWKCRDKYSSDRSKQVLLYVFQYSGHKIPITKMNCAKESETNYEDTNFTAAYDSFLRFLFWEYICQNVKGKCMYMDAILPKKIKHHFSWSSNWEKWHSPAGSDSPLNLVLSSRSPFLNWSTIAFASG